MMLVFLTLFGEWMAGGSFQIMLYSEVKTD